MSKIILITTEGCEGCKIAEKLIRRALNHANDSGIDLEIADCRDDKYRHLINRYQVTDYPTILFMKHNTVLYKYVGTATVKELDKMIGVWLL